MKPSIIRWYIKPVKLNRIGYDASGAYWGIGAPLWYVYSSDDKLAFHIRGTRETAKAAYVFVRSHKDPEDAARHIDATGKTGGF